ncbi:Flp family type IVb pilin [Halopseudomonas bauzanensis]|uniref:Flp family type IVb pilin n=1 Tax=Halopseudomonas bauzanensis TaxID=653930 RepID=A0A4U0YS66_9GAMM|nr:Flp family type IVb pilin [Halopseudomonas bauzanensis]TKA92754.1 Flp family type IVb pilin [Halopseudomonas bauzanensis]
MNTKLIMLMESVRSFVKREDGASAIEYALIAGLIAVAIIGGATLIGTNIEAMFQSIGTKLGITTS